jgi:hypothetical protein
MQRCRTNEVDRTSETGTLALYNRVRRSIDLRSDQDGLDDLCGGLEDIRSAMERARGGRLRRPRETTLGDVLYQDPHSARLRPNPAATPGMPS